MADKEIAIKVENLTKTFKIPLEAHSGLKQKLINTLKGRKGYREFTPLKDISFEIEKGDFFGIVGRNGSGKSTLLKSLAGIYTPNGGAVQVNGTLVPFIELGVGFNPELTGRENVFLNGALLGFSHRQMEEMYDDIVEFAELHDFMEERLKNYSSGMQVRLAFSIAIRAEGDILLLDEVLAVGDEAFQRKCNDYFETLKENGKTVILVTHGMDNVRKYCNKAMMIRDGKIVAIGSPEDVANEYSVENLSSKSDTSTNEQSKVDYLINDIRVDLLSPRKVSQDDNVEVAINYTAPINTKTKILLNLVDINRRVPLYASSTPLNDASEGGRISKKLTIRLHEVNNTSLRLVVSVKDENGSVLGYPVESTLPTFIVRRNDYKKDQEKKNPYAIMFNRGDWSDE